MITLMIDLEAYEILLRKLGAELAQASGMNGYPVSRVAGYFTLYF